MHFILYSILWIVSPLYRIKRGRIVLWSFNFKQYSCNPKYISEYISQHCPSEFEVYWILNKNSSVKEISCSKIVRPLTFQYFKVLLTSEFIVTNTRTDGYSIYFHKRKGQKYIMTWHGGMALKRIEKDAEGDLKDYYVRYAKKDSKMCELMLSCSQLQTNLIKRAFWYDGQILEVGNPRHDIFFNRLQQLQYRNKVQKQYNIGDSNKIILYAPTFRAGDDLSCYNVDWPLVISAFEKQLNTKVTVLLRLHPGLTQKVSAKQFITSQQMKDVSNHDDMQELLCAADILVTDYSSTMFEFLLMKKPCFLYAIDYMDYDRGFYFSLTELPFPLAYDTSTFIANILDFKEERYNDNVNAFVGCNIISYDKGTASKSVVEWMTNKI